MREHKGVKQILKETLKRAKKKEFNGIAVVATHLDGSVSTFTSKDFGNRVALIGGLSILQWRLIEQRDKR